MDSDDEIAILSYTPLKRQKISQSNSSFNSKLYSKAKSKKGTNLKIKSQLSQSQPLQKEQKKNILSKNVQISFSNQSRPSSSSSKISKLSKSSLPRLSQSQFIQKGQKKNILLQNGQKSFSKQSSSSSSNSSELSESSLASTQCFKYPACVPELKPTENSIYKINQDIKNNKKLEPYNISSINSTIQNSSSTQVFNMLDTETPDIDFSQVYTDNINEREGSISDSGPNSSTETESVSLLNDFYTESNYLLNNCSQDFSNHIPKAASNIENKKKLNETSYIEKTNSERDTDLIIHKKTQEKKVAQWLHSSLDYLTSQKIEVTYNHNLNEDIPSCSKSKLNQDNSTQVIQEEKEIQPCIHLHFHVDAPKKTIQPTIDGFFKSTFEEHNQEEGNGANSKGTCTNKADVLKTWNTLMNSMKNAPNTNISSNASNSNVSTASTAQYASKGKKSCPFYKYVEDTSFVVDAFSYGVIDGVSAYFLSHFHYDHYRGLTKNFNRIIYCDEITANLVKLKLRVPDHYLRPLALEESRIIDGVEVTLYDANHCPGSVMFLFKLPTGKTLLHVGDFRAHPNMEAISYLWTCPLDVLYLDTTYLDPRYKFFSQEEILEKCVSIASKHVNMNNRTLILVGSYTIGKERVFKAIASHLDCKIFANSEKRKILYCLDDKQITDRLTNNKFEARVHVVPMSELTPIKLKSYIDSLHPKFQSLVAIKPTGWEHNDHIQKSLENINPKQNGNIFLYGIPYSEHSSYLELQRFVKFVQPKKIIPTVNNGNVSARKKMEYIFKEWRKGYSRSII